MGSEDNRTHGGLYMAPESLPSPDPTSRADGEKWMSHMFPDWDLRTKRPEKLFFFFSHTHTLYFIFTRDK